MLISFLKPCANEPLEHGVHGELAFESIMPCLGFRTHCVSFVVPVDIVVLPKVPMIAKGVHSVLLLLGTPSWILGLHRFLRRHDLYFENLSQLRALLTSFCCLSSYLLPRPSRSHTPFVVLKTPPPVVFVTAVTIIKLFAWGGGG